MVQRTAFVRAHQPSQHVEQGGFARAIRADDADDLTGVSDEVDMVGGDQAAKALDQPFDQEQRFTRAVRRIRRADDEAWFEAASAGYDRLLSDAECTHEPPRRNDPLTSVEHHAY